jgi:hypothetical protein
LRIEGAWIITGGFNTGVMKHVGEAFREYASNVVSDEKIVVLGTCTWDMVANKTGLIQDNAYDVNGSRIQTFEIACV